MKLWQKIVFVMLLVFVIAVGVFVVWGETPLGPAPEALAALQSDSRVQVTNDRWLAFLPAGAQPDTGLVLYPGGRVDYRSYAPQARAIAERGYLVVIVRMPLNLAVLDASAAADVFAAYPQIKHWAVGGHSLGGAMAANFAARNPVQGLVLWASYPADSDDLSSQNLAVTSIYGSQDGVADLDTITGALSRLPKGTVWVELPGGNHAQFGWYGEQGGDNPATLSAAEQQRMTVDATVAVLEQISSK